MALDESYRDYFIRNLHDALSGHTSSSVEEAVKLVETVTVFFLWFPKTYTVVLLAFENEAAHEHPLARVILYCIVWNSNRPLCWQTNKYIHFVCTSICMWPLGIQHVCTYVYMHIYITSVYVQLYVHVKYFLYWIQMLMADCSCQQDCSLLHMWFIHVCVLVACIECFTLCVYSIASTLLHWLYMPSTDILRKVEWSVSESP